MGLEQAAQAGSGGLGHRLASADEEARDHPESLGTWLVRRAALGFSVRVSVPLVFGLA
jgi:hypothetical protein